MMSSSRAHRSLALAATASIAAVLHAGCAQRPPPPEDGIGFMFDVPRVDHTAPRADAMDVSTDDATDDVVPWDWGVDVMVGNPCETARVIDLASVGTRSGATTSFTGSNASAASLGGLRAACVSQVGYEVALRYVATNTSHLRISTVDAATPATFDTVVWLLDRCDEHAIARDCNDDAMPAERRSSFTTIDSVPSGAARYIVVAGFTPPRPNYEATGTFGISVTEVPEVPNGGACDPTAEANVCAAGSQCIGDSGASICIRDGNAGGRCRAVAPGCDPGFGCNGDRLAPTSRCVNEVPPGRSCDPSMHANVCAPGTSCLDLGSGPTCE